MARRSALLALFSLSLTAGVVAAAPERARAEGLVDLPDAPKPEGAVDLPTRQLHPIAIRGEVNVLYDNLYSAGDGFLGVTVAYSVDPNLSVEGTFGWGGDSFATGANVMALGRYAFPIDRAGVHAVTFAAGASGFLGSDYGAVWIARGEIAYELRTRSGFSLLVGGGPALVLANSERVRRDCGGRFCLGGADSQFKAGDVPVHVRLAAGWAF